uniref:Peptidase M15C domain-containing protein n=1 Tax=Ciona savignyi TaxID=51511 RepID=H2Y5B2_CIOSA
MSTILKLVVFGCILTVATSSPCQLTTYSSRKITGHNGHSIRIDSGFLGSMQMMHAAARYCNLTVKVTSSFRKQGQPVPGSIVTPATHSNHLVGRAIDMNVVTPLGWCNSKCLQARKDKYAVCFIDGLKRGGLRWGGDFTKIDPVHLDDNYYNKFPTSWLELFKQHQTNC